MKAFLASLWQNRWRRLACVGVLVGALPLCHSFLRQSIFGPQIDGIPWCVWEDEVRREAHAGEPPSWLTKMMEKIGFGQQQPIHLNSQEVFPVHLHLVEDADPKVRWVALLYVGLSEGRDESAVPALRRHLHDSDAKCRLEAARHLWRKQKDREAAAVALALIDDADPGLRFDACTTLCNMADAGPELFEPIAALATDPMPLLRYSAVHAMRHFGKRGVPVLRRALNDPGPGVRMAAFETAGALGRDADELVPLLQSIEDPNFRLPAWRALHRIDPARFRAHDDGE